MKTKVFVSALMIIKRKRLSIGDMFIIISISLPDDIDCSKIVKNNKRK